ncbi:MAG: hypothetical protein ABIP51_08295 [Bacteroidia bacterium]
MNFKILKPLPPSVLPRDKFQIEITFMEGDADGYKTEKILIDKEKLETNSEFKNEVEILWSSINSACKKDNEGRGGYNDFEKLMKYYKNENLPRFIEYYGPNDPDHPQTIFNELMFSYPSDNDSDFYTSFSEVKITYFSKEGIEHAVSITK